MKNITIANKKINVTLPKNEAKSREYVLSEAMRILAHRNKLKQLPKLQPCKLVGIRNNFKALDESGYVSIGINYMNQFIVKWIEINNEFWRAECFTKEGKIRYLQFNVDAKLNTESKYNWRRRTLKKIWSDMGRELFEWEKQSTTDHSKMITNRHPNWKIGIIGDMPRQIGSVEVR